MRIIASLCLFALALPVTAQEKPYPPGPLPDRIVLTWRRDPARTQTVTWRTDSSVTKAVAQIAKATAGPEFAEKPTKVDAVTAPFKSDAGEAHFHTATFESLTPNTKYAYRVGDGERYSEWSHFQTASEKPEKFTFLYFGDAQYLLKSHWSRVIREAYATAPRARFAIHAGDLVNSSADDKQWGEWFDAASFIHRTMPVIATPGNHEHREEDGKTLSRYWKLQFPMTESGPKDLKGITYSLDYQGVRIVCLNSNDKLQEQAAWLDTTLAQNPQRWTIVTFHHPVLSSAQGRDQPAVRKAWQPIFEKHRVDLALQGHDHCYGRSGLEGGVVYVVSVSGPVFYSVDTTRWMIRKGENVQLFHAITIDGERLSFEARTATGELFDSFELQKQTSPLPNLLTNGTHDPRSIPTRDAQPWNWVAIVAILILAGIVVGLRLIRRNKTA